MRVSFLGSGTGFRDGLGETRVRGYCEARGGLGSLLVLLLLLFFTGTEYGIVKSS